MDYERNLIIIVNHYESHLKMKFVTENDLLLINLITDVKKFFLKPC